MIATVLLAGLLSGTGPESYYSLAAQWGAVGTADMVTTQIGIDNGAIEANPLLRGSLPKRLALEVGLTTAAVWGTHRIEEHSPSLGRKIKWIGIGLRVAVVVLNVRQIRKR